MFLTLRNDCASVIDKWQRLVYGWAVFRPCRRSAHFPPASYFTTRLRLSLTKVAKEHRFPEPPSADWSMNLEELKQTGVPDVGNQERAIPPLKDAARRLPPSLRVKSLHFSPIHAIGWYRSDAVLRPDH